MDSVPITALWVLLDPDDDHNTMTGLYWSDAEAEKAARANGWRTYCLMHYHVRGALPERLRVDTMQHFPS